METMSISKRVSIIFRYSSWLYDFDIFEGQYIFLVYRNSVVGAYHLPGDMFHFIGNGFWDFMVTESNYFYYFRLHGDFIAGVVDRKLGFEVKKICEPGIIMHGMPFIDYTLGLKTM